MCWMPRTVPGLVYIERSKTDQTGEGAYVVVTPVTLLALKQCGKTLKPGLVMILSLDCRCRR